MPNDTKRKFFLLTCAEAAAAAHITNMAGYLNYQKELTSRAGTALTSVALDFEDIDVLLAGRPAVRLVSGLLGACPRCGMVTQTENKYETHDATCTMPEEQQRYDAALARYSALKREREDY